MEKIFWVDGDFEAVGGIYLRNDLFKFFEKLEEKGIKPVGIKIDGTWNIEILVQNNEAYKTHLLNSEQNHERSVATEADSSTGDG